MLYKSIAFLYLLCTLKIDSCGKVVGYDASKYNCDSLSSTRLQVTFNRIYKVAAALHFQIAKIQCYLPVDTVFINNETRLCAYRRTGQQPFGGSNRVLPEWRTQIV